MQKAQKLTQKQLDAALVLSRQVGKLAVLHKAKAAIQRRVARLERQIVALEAEIMASAAIRREQLETLLSQHSGASVDAAVRLGNPEQAKQRHKPSEKQAFLLECLRRHQKLHPADEAVRLEWLRREFEERFTLRPISNTTIYFASIIEKSWYLPTTNTRNRAIDLKKASRGLSTRT
jgi:hypothetical protein